MSRRQGAYRKVKACADCAAELRERAARLDGRAMGIYRPAEAEGGGVVCIYHAEKRRQRSVRAAKARQ